MNDSVNDSAHEDTLCSRADRRRARRSAEPSDHGIQSVRIKLGAAAAVIDASAAGALIETNHRLLPGAFVELHMDSGHRRVTVRGRVVRCAVVEVRAAGLLYRGGIAFEEHLPWFVPDAGYPLPTGEQSASRG